MGAKATGAEIQAFYEAWPPGDGWYHDDSIETHNGEGGWILEPTTKYDLDDLGTINWQGDRKAAPDGERTINFGSWFKLWKKEQTTTLVVVTVSKDEVDALLAYCKTQGWKTKVAS